METRDLRDYLPHSPSVPKRRRSGPVGSSDGMERSGLNVLTLLRCARLLEREEARHSLLFGGSSSSGSGSGSPPLALVAKTETSRPPRTKIKKRSSSPPGPVLLDKFRSMGAVGPGLRIISKEVTPSDVNIDQNRLLLSRADVEETSLLLEPLTTEERALVRSKVGLVMVVVDGEEQEYKMKLKYLESNAAYRLIDQWSSFVKANDLKPHLHTLHLCFFRVGEQLRMAIVKSNGSM